MLMVLNTGVVWWTPTAVFETSCSLDVTYYPFDTQKCSIFFQPELLGTYDVRFVAHSLGLDHYTANGQWELLDTQAKYRLWNGVYLIEFQLKLRRRPFFYVLNLILPVVFLSLTSSLVFALPADVGEKVGLSVTVLLAYAVYLTLLTDSMPSTSMQASVMAVYLMILLGVCAVNVVLTVCVLRLHHRPTPLTGRAARWARAIRRVLRYPEVTRPLHLAATDTADGKGHAADGKGHAADGKGHAADGKGHAADGKGHAADGKGHAADGKGHAADGKPDSPHRPPQVVVDAFQASRRTVARRPGGKARDGGDGEEAVSGAVVAEAVDGVLLVVGTAVSLGTTLLCLLALIAGSATNALDTSLV